MVRSTGFLLAKTGGAIAGANVVLVVLDVVVAVSTGTGSGSGSDSLEALAAGGGAAVDVEVDVEVDVDVDVDATVVGVVDVVDVVSAWTGTVEVVVVVSGAVSTGTLYPLNTMRFGDPTPALATGVAVAVETTNSWVCAGVSVTSSSKSMATTPLTTGAAIDVPDTLRSEVAECIDGDTMSVPGANRSTHAPKFE